VLLPLGDSQRQRSDGEMSKLAGTLHRARIYSLWDCLDIHQLLTVCRRQLSAAVRGMLATAVLLCPVLCASFSSTCNINMRTLGTSCAVRDVFKVHGVPHHADVCLG
jgi:hypothetical protein